MEKIENNLLSFYAVIFFSAFLSYAWQRHWTGCMLYLMTSLFCVFAQYEKGHKMNK